MWSYYGSKSKIAKYYPKPIYGKIIEPFAGAAWYSARYSTRKISLSDKNQIIYGIWDWLINAATINDLTEHQNLYLGDNLNDRQMAPAHRWLLGFIINRGSSTPANIVQKWSCQVVKRPTWASTVAYQIERIITFLPEIKKWHIENEDYCNIKNEEATWFIDPPYQEGGQYYPEHDIDYSSLAEWCTSRKGQVIVCENAAASWLDFVPLTSIHGQRKKTTEMVWTNVK